MTNSLISEMNSIRSLDISWTNGNVLSYKCFSYYKFSVLKRYFTFLTHFSNFIIWRIFNVWYFFRILTITKSIARYRCIHSKSLMRPFCVINISPILKDFLALINRFALTIVEYFRFQRTMKSFIFSRITGLVYFCLPCDRMPFSL